MLLTPESLSKNSQTILNRAHDMGIENVFVYSVDTQFDVVQGFIIDDPKRELIDSKTKSEFEDYLKNFFGNKWLDVEQKAGLSPDSFSVHKTALDTAILISELKPDKSFLEQFQEQQQKSLKKEQEAPPEKRQGSSLQYSKDKGHSLPGAS